MRRPLKPFVTEYKGNRRQPQSQPGPDITQNTGEFGGYEADRARPRPIDFSMRPETEDSYEAAMRAADALFARPKQGFAESPAAQFEAPADEENAAPSSAPSERGGRILRALDEQPPPQLAALEAAHAPKRRGRKPGSKNKPKVIEPEVARALPPDTPIRPATLRPRVASHPVAVTSAPQPALADASPALRTLEALPAARTRSEQSQRFSWVRDRLKPGESWKRRRLPRICW